MVLDDANWKKKKIVSQKKFEVNKKNRFFSTEKNDIKVIVLMLMLTSYLERIFIPYNNYKKKLFLAIIISLSILIYRHKNNDSRCNIYAYEG